PRRIFPRQQETTPLSPAGAPVTRRRPCRVARRGDNEGMAKRIKDLEARLSRVERELAEFRAALKIQPAQPWYRQIVGDYARDPVMQEILRLGRCIRSGKKKIRG